MKEKLLNLLNNSYSPYSHFRVACIVSTKDGKEFVGVNVENASYGATICAERSALLSAVSNGYKKDDIVSLHVMCDTEKFSYPCFACRQVMSEIMNKNTPVIIMNNLGEKEEKKVFDLCPYPFDKDDLV